MDEFGVIEWRIAVCEKKIFYFGPKMVEFLDNSQFYPILPKFLDLFHKKI